MSKQQARKRAARRQDSLFAIASRIKNSARSIELPEPPILAKWIERYRRLRRQAVEFNNPLVAAIDMKSMHHAAKELGILRRGILVFESEEEMNVLMDHALYHAPSGGASIVETYFRDHPPAPGSDAEALFRAKRGAKFTLSFVVKRFPGFGLEVRDLLTDQPFLVADINFSNSQCEGFTLAGRLLPLDDFWMFSGAMVPILHPDALERIAQYFDRVFGGWRPLEGLPPDRQRLAESFILRTCLEYNPFERMRTENV